MNWKMENGRNAPSIAVSTAEKAAAKHEVPVGILLGTVECESDFRLGLTSSAGAVGPCQFLPKYKSDYYRYAGFEFDLEGWESIEGMAAVYKFYAELGADRYNFKDEEVWEYALLAHRYGQNSTKAKNLDRNTDRIKDVEAMMKRNDLWYDVIVPGEKVDSSDDKDEAAEDIADIIDGTETNSKWNPSQYASVAKKAAEWAEDKIGCRYSQAERTKEDVFDCSSLVARAYSAQGVDWDLVGSKVPNSTQEVYSDQFELLLPESYDKIGKTMGNASVIRKGLQAGDLQFLCTDSGTSRSNKITHVTIVKDHNTIVHARGTKYGVVGSEIDLYAGKVCAILRFNPSAPLRKGMKGLRVKKLQELLNEQGANLDVDGNFGSKTEAAADKYGVG